MPASPRRWWPLVLLAVAAFDAPIWFGHIPQDVKIYRLGARAVLDGVDLYSPAVHYHQYGFTYPPFAALPMVLLAVVPGWLAMTVMTLASTAALVVVVRLCAPGLLARARASWPALALAAAVGVAEPVFATLHNGQVGLILLALVVVDELRLRDGRWAGVLIGIAAGIKLTPAIFLVLLLAERRLAALRNAVLALAATAGIAALVRPHDSREFWTSQLLGSDHIGETARLDNQSWNGLFQRLAGHTGTATALWLVASLLTVAAGYWIARRLVALGEHVLALGVIGLVGCLVSPVSWTHHWVWFVPFTLGLYRRTGPEPWRTRTLVATAAVMVVGASRNVLEPLYRPTIGEFVLGNFYVWAAVALLAAVAVEVRGAGRRVPAQVSD